MTVDGKDGGVAPASVEADPACVACRSPRPGLKTWESSVVVKAGETLAIGPITLGQPDAELTLRSKPSGAEITVGRHVSRPHAAEGGPARGHRARRRRHAAGLRELDASPCSRTPGRKITLDAKLQAVLARVTVQGEPADAELFIDGKSRGRTPQTFDLSATEHSVEVRKEGFISFTGSVTPALGLERSVDYKLVSSDRGDGAAGIRADHHHEDAAMSCASCPAARSRWAASGASRAAVPNEGFRAGHAASGRSTSASPK